MNCVLSVNSMIKSLVHSDVFLSITIFLAERSLTCTFIDSLFPFLFKSIVKFVNHFINISIKVFKAVFGGDGRTAHWTMVFAFGPTNDTMLTKGMVAIKNCGLILKKQNNIKTICQKDKSVLIGNHRRSLRIKLVTNLICTASNYPFSYNYTVFCLQWDPSV